MLAETVILQPLLKDRAPDLKCEVCGAAAKKNRTRCVPCEDAYWLAQPVSHRPWSWCRNYVTRRDGNKCRHCNRKRQNFYPNCLVLRNLRNELGRELTSEETALVLGIPVEELYLQLTVHHIQPRSEGGTNDLSNLITLCRACHDKVHNQAPKGKPKRKKRKGHANVSPGTTDSLPGGSDFP